MNSLIVIAFFTAVAFGANPAQRFISRQLPSDSISHDKLQRLADRVVTAAAATVAFVVVTLLLNAPFSFASDTVYFLSLLVCEYISPSITTSREKGSRYILALVARYWPQLKNGLAHLVATLRAALQR